MHMHMTYTCTCTCIMFYFCQQNSIDETTTRTVASVWEFVAQFLKNPACKGCPIIICIKYWYNIHSWCMYIIFILVCSYQTNNKDCCVRICCLSFFVYYYVRLHWDSWMTTMMGVSLIHSLLFHVDIISSVSINQTVLECCM